MPGSTFVGGSIDIHVRFEALGGNARRAQIFRRHEDLQRSYEHQVKAFARETRHVTSKLSRIQSEHLTRMKAIQSLEPQSFREEWPPVEERREIVAQMQDGLPLLTGASLSKQGSQPKTKDNGLKRSNGNKSSPKALSPKQNGISSNAHRTHTKTRVVQSPKAKLETSVLPNHSVRKEVSQGNPRVHQPVPQRLVPPAIVLSHAEPQNPPPQIASASQAAVSPRPVQSTAALNLPSNPSSHLGSSTRDETSVSSNPGHRRRWRARHPWIKQENVLLFKVEGREGKETYTQVAQRKYPSYI